MLHLYNKQAKERERETERETEGGRETDRERQTERDGYVDTCTRRADGESDTRHSLGRCWCEKIYGCARACERGRASRGGNEMRVVRRAGGGGARRVMRSVGDAARRERVGKGAASLGTRGGRGDG